MKDAQAAKKKRKTQKKKVPTIGTGGVVVEVGLRGPKTVKQMCMEEGQCWEMQQHCGALLSPSHPLSPHSSRQLSVCEAVLQCCAEERVGPLRGRGLSP